MRKRIIALMTLLLLTTTTATQAADKVTIQEKRALAQLACKNTGGGDSIASLNCRGKSLAQTIEEIEFKKIDLNRDGQAEYQLSASAEVIKRVNVVIYQKAPQGYRLLFKGLSEGVEVKKTRTNGYLDLEEMDAGVGPFYRLYKYDGKQYKESDCWREETDAKGHSVRKRCESSTR